LTQDWSNPIKFETILFATDFSPASYAASVYATALAAHFGSVLTLLHVFLPSQSAQEAEARDGVVSDQRRLQQHKLVLTTEALTPKGGKANYLLKEGDPSRLLPSVASEFTRAMLVLGTHGGNSLGRRLIGSVAEDTLRSSTIPVLTVGQQVKTSGAVLPFQRILYVTSTSPIPAEALPLARGIAQSFSSRLDVVNVVDESDSQNAHREILGYLKHDHYDLLVLGIEQQTSLGFADRNSGAIRIIAESPCPVLTMTEVTASLS
jgi:nucleotide-binding universal stress UspA family protein